MNLRYVFNNKDEIYQIRSLIVQFLCKGLILKQLSENLSCILLLAAHDPENDIKQTVRSHFNRVRHQRIQKGSHDTYMNTNLHSRL